MERTVKYIFVGLVILFFVSAYYGYTLSQSQALFANLQKFFEKFKGFLKSPPLFMLLIFANNSVKSLIAMLGGFFFGIVPIIFVISNGYILGLAVSYRLPQWGILRVVAAILPHGILEIPAILIACSYGVWLGIKFADALFRGKEFKPHLIKALKVYLRVVLPMLFVAAIIEAFITPVLVHIV